MKKLIMCLLGLSLASCQQSAPLMQREAKVPAVKPEVVESKAQARQELPVLFAASDTLTQPMREFLAQHDLSALWANEQDSAYPDPSFEGFFGPDYYRFGMVFNKVRRDLTNPALYHVQGKSCYFKSKNVRPFSGKLTVRRLVDLHYPGFLKQRAEQFSSAADSLAGHTYTAYGQLQLQEESQENSGRIEGEVVLDFFIVPGQAPAYVYVFDHDGRDDKLPTRGARLLLRGNRLNLTTGQVKSFLVAPDVSAIAPDLFKDFMLDERMGQINPKYAKLGWNEYWKNDEWWAESPKPFRAL
ncbi:hypothetical protein GCM10023185_35720 [Hymenobacter saemangeumensis]|uniref:DUF4861 domain-containing protein n=1 Tax=Hymenobacter saemangeumensis TaxID=1084522 RepID=A0ABP8IQ82_9BACT